MSFEAQSFCGEEHGFNILVVGPTGLKASILNVALMCPTPYRGRSSDSADCLGKSCECIRTRIPDRYRVKASL